MSSNGPPAARVVPLDALRGVAALVVVAWHFLLAFVPGLVPTDFDPSTPPAAEGLIGSPLLFVANGGAAVTVFFVLSGYVLTRGVLGRPGWATLQAAALKRWPRLALPVLASVMLSYACFALGLYVFRAAGEASGSPFMFTFSRTFELDPAFEPSLGAAVVEGAIGNLAAGQSAYNSALWTMRVELLGSVFSFALVALGRRGWRGASVAIGALAVVVAPHLGAFALGSGLAWLLRARAFEVSVGVFAAAVAVACYLLGYRDPVGAYALFGDLPRAYAHQAAAVLLIVALSSHPTTARALSGRVGRALGGLSFPLYLVHVPVLCSVSAAAYLLATYLEVHSALVLGVTASATIAGAAPLVLAFAALDRWWVARVNAVARRYRRGPSTAAEASASRSLEDPGAALAS